MSIFKVFSAFSFACLIFSPLSPEAFAGYKGQISFATDEIATHRAHIQTVVEEAASCIQADLAHQREFFKKNGIAAFYGSRSEFSKLSDSAKRAEIKKLGKNPALLDQMRPTSCIGLALECLGQGFAKADEVGLWKKIKAYTVLNEGDGTALQFGLQKLGWKILYWNADPAQNAAWDKQEKAADPTDSQHFFGDHVASYQQALTKKHYYYTDIDDTESLRDLSQFTGHGDGFPGEFLKIPFFVGIAHFGYHVFPGYTGAQIVEAHSTRKISDPKTIESNAFNPIHGGSPEGAPTGEAYRSGLIAIPPGYSGS